MKRNNRKGGSILNAENAKHGERYVRKREKMQEQREAVHAVWHEISQIGKRGLN